MKKAALEDSTGQKVNDSRREKVITWNSEKGKAAFSFRKHSQEDTAG